MCDHALALRRPRHPARIVVSERLTPPTKATPKTDATSEQRRKGRPGERLRKMREHIGAGRVACRQGTVRPGAICGNGSANAPSSKLMRVITHGRSKPSISSQPCMEHAGTGVASGKQAIGHGQLRKAIYLLKAHTSHDPDKARLRAAMDHGCRSMRRQDPAGCQPRTRDFPQTRKKFLRRPKLVAGLVRS